MQKTALKITAQMQSALLRDGRLTTPLPIAERDGYAAMAVWMEGDMRVERLRLADIRLIPIDLRLDTSPLQRLGMAYELIGRRDWLVIARLAAKDAVEVALGIAYAYPDPMLVYCGWRGERRSIITGAINLRDAPTVVGLRLSAGKNYSALGATELTDADADDDLLAVAQCLGKFYGI